MSVAPYNFTNRRPPAFFEVVKSLLDFEIKHGPIEKLTVIKTYIRPKATTADPRISIERLSCYFQFLTMQGMVIGASEGKKFFVDIERCQVIVDAIENDTTIPSREGSEAARREAIEQMWQDSRRQSATVSASSTPTPIPSNESVPTAPNPTKELEISMTKPEGNSNVANEYEFAAFLTPIEHELHYVFAAETHRVSVNDSFRTTICCEDADDEAGIGKEVLAKRAGCSVAEVTEAIDFFVTNKHVVEIEGEKGVLCRTVEILYDPMKVYDVPLGSVPKDPELAASLPILAGFEPGRKVPVKVSASQTTKVEPATQETPELGTHHIFYIEPFEARVLLLADGTRVGIGMATLNIQTRIDLRRHGFYETVTGERTTARLKITELADKWLEFRLLASESLRHEVVENSLPRNREWHQELEAIAVTEEPVIEDTLEVIEMTEGVSEVLEVSTVSEVVAEETPASVEETPEETVEILTVMVTPPEAELILAFASGKKTQGTSGLTDKTVRTLKKLGFFLVSGKYSEAVTSVVPEKGTCLRFAEKDPKNPRRFSTFEGLPDSNQWRLDLEAIAVKVSLPEPSAEIEVISEVVEVPEIVEIPLVSTIPEADPEVKDNDEDVPLKSIEELGDTELAERIVSFRQTRDEINAEITCMEAEQVKRRRHALRAELAKKQTEVEELRRHAEEATAAAVALEAELAELG